MKDEQIQLEIDEPSTGKEDRHRGAAVEVCRASFDGTGPATVDELFDGFSSLRAITYSSGMGFMTRIVGKFADAEVVFGNPAVMAEELHTVMAFQKEVVRLLSLSRNAKAFSDRMADGTLRLFASRDMRSHEKLYLLEADDGRRRVITGSANFSASAFCGLQRENIIVFDDDAAWDYFSARYTAYKEDCSDHIDRRVVGRVAEEPEYLDDNVEEIPVSATVKAKELVVLQEDDSAELEEEIVFVADVRGHESELKPLIPKPTRKGGATLIQPDFLRKLAGKVKETRRVIKQRRNIMPVLHLDLEDSRLFFNKKELSLSPDEGGVASDAAVLTGYLESIADTFYGDVAQTQRNFWRFANWYFSSVFAPALRWEASANNYDVTNFPVFGIIYGDSNGGKSTFTHLLAKMMCGAKVEFSASETFTPSRVDRLRANCEGLPIHIDDLARKQYNEHRERVIKDDMFGLYDHNVNYPAIAISTNSIPALSPDIAKRTVVCHISTRIDRKAGLRSAKSVNDMIEKAGCALFCEYIGRMVPKVREMIESMRGSDADYFPDLFAVSSETLCEILGEHSETLPAYIAPLDFDDYFGDRTVSQNAISKIRNAWLSEPDSFAVNENEGRLVYSYPDGANKWELTYIKDELPVQLDAKAAGRSLSMNLAEARDLFGLDFRRPWYSRLLRR